MPRKKSGKSGAAPPRGGEVGATQRGSHAPFVDPNPERQAVPSFRGYAYQAYQTIRAWLNCGKNEQILCEFGEDIATIRLDADGRISAIELDQVKHRQGSITLRTKTVVKAIDSLFAHMRSNPNLQLYLRVSTISDRGNEHGVDWRHAACGLDLWDRIRADQQVPGEAFAILRKFLKDQLNLSSEVRAFLETADDSKFKSELVSRIFWDTGDQNYSDIQVEIARLLAARPRPIAERDELDAVTDRLWRHVTERMASIEAAPLTKQELDAVLLRETTAQVDRQTLRRIAGGMERLEGENERIEGGINSLLDRVLAPGGAQLSVASDTAVLDRPPSLPELCSSRGELVERLRRNWHEKKILWIHGWTGSGKSTLANLLIAEASASAIWCNLRGLEEFALGTKLTRLLYDLYRLDHSSPTIVCDDLFTVDLATQTAQVLRTIIGFIVKQGFKLVVTGQGPPPSRFVSEFTSSLSTISAPALDEREILELLQLAGLTNESTAAKWATYLLAITGGHPQLVSARIIHARQLGWKLSGDQLLTEPRSVEQVKAEARRFLGDSITSEESREMARRLSVVMGVFSRNFAMNLGLATPTLKEPGRAFDKLVGPWIEPIGDKQFALSPLLGGYAEAEFGTRRLREYNGIAAFAWLHERTITPVQIIQMIATAVAGQSEHLLIKVSAWLVRQQQPEIGRIAKHIGLLSKFMLEDERSLSTFGVPARFILRQAQLKVAALNSDWKSYTALDNSVVALLSGSATQPNIDDLRLIHFVSTSLVVGSPIPFAERLSRALDVAAATKRMASREARSFLGTAPVGDLIMTVSVTAQTPNDLCLWVEALRKLDPKLRRKVFAAFDHFLESYSLTVGHIWQRMSASSNPDWEACLSAFREVRVFADENRNGWLAAAAIRSEMVILDEFQNDSGAALRLAAEARRNGCDHPLVDFGEATVRYRSGDYAGNLRLVDRAEQRIGPRQIPIERVFALTYALRAGSTLYVRGEEKIGRLERIVKLGKRISSYARKETFALVATIGFNAESAWLAHERGKYRSAVMGLTKVVESLQVFPDQSERLFRALRLRIGHAIAWLSQGAAKTEMLQTPYPGWFANLEEPAQDLMTRPGAPYPMMWATLAEYAALVDETRAGRRCLRRAGGPTPGQQYYLGALQAADALFSCYLLEGKLESALQAGIDYVRLLSIGGVMRRKERDWPPLTEPIDLSQLYEANKAEVTENYVQNIPAFVLAPVLMAACARQMTPTPKFNNWRGMLKAAVGEQQLVLEAVDMAEIGYRAVVADDNDAARIAKRYAQDAIVLHEHLRIFPTIIAAALKSAEPRELLGFEASALEYAIRLRGSHWSLIFCRMVRHTWTQIARKQAFKLVTPRFSAEEILRAASPRLFGLRQCANLLIVGARATGTRWPNEALGELRRLAS